MHKKVSILRNFASFTLGLTDVEIAPPNDRRIAMIISPPPLVIGAGQPLTTFSPAVSVGTTGVKATLTVPAGQTYRVTGASTVSTTAPAALIRLQIVRAAVTLSVWDSGTTLSPPIGFDLLPLDVLQWNVIVIGAAGVADFYLSAEPLNSNARVTLTYQNPPVLDAGINLYAGQQQYILDAKLIGQSIREDIHAVANVAGTIIGVMDIFTDCPCMLSEIQW